MACVLQDSCGREPAVKVEVWFNGHNVGKRERKLRVPVSLKAMAEVVKLLKSSRLESRVNHRKRVVLHVDATQRDQR